MTDIIGKLRDAAARHDVPPELGRLLTEAASEIERLAGQVAVLQEAVEELEIEEEMHRTEDTEK